MNIIQKITRSLILSSILITGNLGYSDQLEPGQFPLTIGGQKFIVGMETTDLDIVNYGIQTFGSQPKFGAGIFKYTRPHSKDSNEVGDSLFIWVTPDRQLASISLRAESQVNTLAIENLIVWLNAMDVQPTSENGFTVYQHGGWRFQYAAKGEYQLETISISHIERKKELSLN